MNTTSFHFFSAAKNGLVPLIRSNLHLFVGESNSLAKRGKNEARKKTFCSPCFPIKKRKFLSTSKKNPSHFRTFIFLLAFFWENSYWSPPSLPTNSQIAYQSEPSLRSLPLTGWADCFFCLNTYPSFPAKNSFCFIFPPLLPNQPELRDLEERFGPTQNSLSPLSK